MMVELKAHSWATQRESIQQSIESCDYEFSQSLDADEGSK